MNLNLKSIYVYSFLAFGSLGNLHSQECALLFPDPDLVFLKQEESTTPGGVELVKFYLSVSNYTAYPDELFQISPNLPPCGENPNASRSWVNIYSSNGTYLYGFCAFTASEHLTKLWFAIPKSETIPAKVYIEIVDRKCNHVYKSNNVPLVSLIIENPYKSFKYAYKGQIHCHSIRSDGEMSPQAVVDKYIKADYDFLALTDHEIKARIPFIINPFATLFKTEFIMYYRVCYYDLGVIFKDLPYKNMYIPPNKDFLLIPGEEGLSKKCRPHLVELGIKNTRYPKVISSYWHNWPSSFNKDMDAAAYWKSRNCIYFFKGSNYVRYNWGDDKVPIGYPKLIREKWNNWPSSSKWNEVDAATEYKNKYLYFFKGDEYIRYNLRKDKVDKGYPNKIVDYWGNWPSDFIPVDAAAYWGGKKIYFFKNDSYIRYDMDKKKVDPNYPRSIPNNWAGINSQHLPLDAAVAIWPMYTRNYKNAYFFYNNNYLKYDMAGKYVLCQERNGNFSMDKQLQWTHNSGGLNIAAHPYSKTEDDHNWTMTELKKDNIDGLEVGVDRKGISNKDQFIIWDNILSSGRKKWGFATDDHDFNFKWIVVCSDRLTINHDDIMNRIKNGSFYSVTRKNVEFPTPQIIDIKFIYPNIYVECTGADEVKFIANSGLIVKCENNFDEDESNIRSCELKLEYKYIRIELSNSYGSIAYSQPIFIYPNN